MTHTLITNDVKCNFIHCLFLGSNCQNQVELNYNNVGKKMQIIVNIRYLYVDK